MIVDTHCHAGLEKYEPVESVVDQMFRHRVDAGVLVQHLGQYDNQYLVDVAARYPGRFAVLVMVDVTRDDAPERLAYWAAKANVRGARIKAADRSPGKNPWAIWEAADALGMSITLNGKASDYSSDTTLELARRFPKLRMVVEHLGRPSLADGPNGAEFKRTLRLAELPNVWLKISGFHVFGEASTQHYPEWTPFIRAGLSAFGAERCMWATNYPPVSNAEGYHNTITHARDHWPWKDDRERRLVMGDNAAAHYLLAQKQD